MVRVARYVYFALAWAFLVAMVVQVFFMGLGYFAQNRDFSLHVALGWILHLAPILILIAAAVGRAGMANILAALGLAATVFVVPILATMRSDAPILAALHPVAAILAFWLSIVVARASTAVALGWEGRSPASPAASG